MRYIHAVPGQNEGARKRPFKVESKANLTTEIDGSSLSTNVSGLAKKSFRVTARVEPTQNIANATAVAVGVRLPILKARILTPSRSR